MVLKSLNIYVFIKNIFEFKEMIVDMVLEGFFWVLVVLGKWK